MKLITPTIVLISGHLSNSVAKDKFRTSAQNSAARRKLGPSYNEGHTSNSVNMYSVSQKIPPTVF